MKLEGYGEAQALHDGVRTTILRARRLADNRSVILKQLRTPFPTSAELGRLRRELDLARAAAGPGVVEMLGLRAGEGTAWLEMEDFRGVSLEAFCAKRPATVPVALEIASRLVSTLDQVHKAGIIHKDVTPSNVLVDPETHEVKLIDFGIASTQLQVPVRVDRLEGTTSYMSPEQTGRMNRAVDWRSDYYSLGATLYFLLTGSPPFPGTDPLEAVHAHIARRPVAPRELIPSIPEPVSDLVMMLLAKRADDRYQSAAGLKHDLERCLSELRERGSIAPFVLRREDRTEKLRIPDTLYGRTAEIAALEAAVDRVARGGSEGFFVTGGAGTGKTSLVGEVHRGAAIHRALFVSGKFEQFQRDVPYSSMLRALRGFIHQLLALEPARVEAWRLRLAEALGDTGGVLAEALPELTLLVGAQPEAPEVPALEAENRFRNTLVRLVAALPSSSSPAVLFFDDLQWADLSSIALIEQLLVDPALQRVLVLGAWRSNEVDDAHPLSRSLNRANDLGARVSRVELAPLAMEDVRQLLAETLSRSEEEVSALAHLGHTWTAGNPFVLHRVIDRLGEQGLIRREGDRWIWDLLEITRRGLGLDSAGFLARRLEELPDETRRALEVASCVGAHFSASILASALQCSRADVRTRLAPALALNLVHPLSHEWWPDATDDLELEFAFSHDRIQEAAHNPLSPTQAREIHLRVGRLLRERLGADVFEVAHHLNLAVELLSIDERASLLSLDAEAGRRALRSGAFAPAAQLLEQAVALLVPEAWGVDDEAARSLVLDAARASSLAGARDRMDAHLTVALAHARTPLHRAAALEIRALDRASREVLEAIDIALEAMAELGVVLPRRPTPAEVEAAMGAAMGPLMALGPDGVIALPELDDPVVAEVVHLANTIMTPAYLAVPMLLPVLAAEIVKQTVARGVAPEANFGYAALSLILTAVGALEPGRQIGQLSLRLLERFHDRGHETRPAHAIFGHVMPFTLPLREAVARHAPYLARGLAAGDHEYAMWIAHLVPANSFYAGIPLDTLAVDLDREVRAMRRFGQQTPLDCSEPLRRLVRVLRSQTARPDRMDEEGDTEEAHLATLLTSNSRGAVYIHQLLRMYLRYLNRDLAGALELANAGESFADGAAATYHIIWFQQTVALLCLGLADSAPSADARAALVARARANRALLAPPSAHAPHNHQHRLNLIDAELARIEGDALTAIDSYDAAIKAARENGFVQDEALANELAGRFYLSRGRLTAARAYLLEACSAWARWGATAKVRQLETELPEVVGRGLSAARTAELDVDLDLETLSKATLAITSEIRTDRLVERVLAVSMQNAGATRGLLLLDRDGALRLEAAQGEGLASPGTPLAQLTGVPVSILQYVARTGTQLVLSDARRDARFASDPALSQDRPLSVLALPLMLRGRASGLIYLENDLTPDAFPSARIQLQEMLGAQAATSLQNARLYDEMETQVARRTQELSVAKENLENTNRELEQRVQVKVTEALATADQMQSLSQRLQERVRDRSRELSRALDQLSSGSPKRSTGLVSGTVLSDSVRIVRQIGAGGMGAVYLGEDLRTHEQVAVKVVLAARLRDSLAMQRFLRESRAAASVFHPAVARTLGVDVSEDGLIFQVQEFVDGEPLTRIVEGGRWLTGGEAARLGSLLASALGEAHAAGVVHRDLKPSNVMLTASEPGLKLLDFGIARLAGDASEPQLTGTGQLVGTPDYMAPEQILSPDHVDGKIDVYALGVLLYWALAGRLPHRSVHLAARTVLDPIPLDAVVANVPTQLSIFVMACLARDPLERPTSLQLAEDLAKVAEGTPSLPLMAAGRISVAREQPIENDITRVKKDVGTIVGIGHEPADAVAETSRRAPAGNATEGDRPDKREE